MSWGSWSQYFAIYEYYICGVGSLAGIAAAERRAVRRMIRQHVILKMIGAGGRSILLTSQGTIGSVRRRTCLGAAGRRNLQLMNI